MASATGNSKAPYVRLVLYYVILAIVVTLIRLMWPEVYALFAQGASVGASLFGGPPAEPTGPLTEQFPALATTIMISGAFVVMLPVAWVYMIRHLKS